MEKEKIAHGHTHIHRDSQFSQSSPKIEPNIEHNKIECHILFESIGVFAELNGKFMWTHPRKLKDKKTARKIPEYTSIAYGYKSEFQAKMHWYNSLIDDK